MQKHTFFKVSAAAALMGLLSAGTAWPATMSTLDKSFVTKAAKSGVEEVRDGEAMRTGGSADSRSFAMRMIHDHSNANAQLKSLAAQIGATAQVESGTAAAEPAQKMSGTAYLRKEVGDHEQAVALFQREAKSGHNADLRSFAQKTLPTLEMHLQLAQKYAH